MKKSVHIPIAIAVVAVASFILTISTATAATIFIGNAGFESPGGGGFPFATSWAGVNTALHASLPQPGNGSLGTSFGYTNPGEAFPDGSQTVGASYGLNTIYTFQGYSVDNGFSDSDLRFTLGYDNSGSFVELVGATYSMDGLGWTLLDGVTYTTGSSGAELGKNIIVRLTAIGGPGEGAWFDEVSLTAVSIPESSSVLLFGFTPLALMRRRRK